jgi:tRNA (guanine-N7-)-methyltransferase
MNSHMAEPTKSRRPIRSFVRREGRMTLAQKRALKEFWPRYGVELKDSPLDLAAIFGRRAPVALEIGFGNGEALATVAARHPLNDYLGVEVHRPGVGRLLRGLVTQDLTNVRVICADANDVLARLPDNSLAAVYLFFPDPWPKKRHHKRRLVHPAFVEAIRRRLTVGGVLCLATDWEDYAVHMLAALSQTRGFENTAGDGQFAARQSERPLTRFERRGHKLGHVVRDLIFQRVA